MFVIFIFIETGLRIKFLHQDTGCACEVQTSQRPDF